MVIIEAARTAYSVMTFTTLSRLQNLWKHSHNTIQTKR